MWSTCIRSYSLRRPWFYVGDELSQIAPTGKHRNEMHVHGTVGFRCAGDYAVEDTWGCVVSLRRLCEDSDRQSKCKEESANGKHLHKQVW
jgi:hypothetical protein